MPGVVHAVESVELNVIRGKREVLCNVSFTVPYGQVVGLLGPSGSGKSTLMRAVVGAQSIASGRVEVLGCLAGSAELRRRVGYVTQSPSVYSDLTVVQNLRYFAEVVGAPRNDVGRVMSEVRLSEHGNRRVESLSGGEFNRVSLAIALLGNPELLVLDEPTVGLDPVLRQELWALFGSLAATGVALLVSTHVMDEARRCDRILVLHHGRLLADDTPEGLLSGTATTDTDAAFLALIAGASS